MITHAQKDPTEYANTQTINLIQNQISDWTAHNFPNTTAVEQFLGIAEEVGELSHAILKNIQDIRLNEDHEAQERDAIGDITIYILNYCNHRGINFLDVVEETWSKVQQRDWQKHKNDGVGQSPA